MTTKGGKIQFDVGVNIFPAKGVLTASYGDVEMAKLTVVPYPMRTRLVLVIRVNGATNITVNLGGVNAIYKQAVTEFMFGSEMTFDYPDAPQKWKFKADDITQNDLYILCDKIEKHNDFKEIVGTYDHIVVLLPGSLDSNIKPAGATVSKQLRDFQNYSFLFSDVGDQQADIESSLILAHEFGHNFGLDHKDLTGIDLARFDFDNLMQGPPKKDKSKLRYFQWEIINPFED